MAYSYTERKRIRKNFGSRDSVLEIPYLLQMQKDAYTAFLQAEVPQKKRTDEGLQAVFKSVFPISDFSGKKMELHFLDHSIGEPKYDAETAKQKNLTYEAPLKVHVQLINKETGEIETFTRPYEQIVPGDRYKP